jgi:predicted metal-dependent phosphoesterase TrpH
MKIDMHIHTERYSGCSNISPFALLERAKQVGLDSIAITEHNMIWQEEEKMELIKRAKGLVLLFGVEVNVKKSDEAIHSKTGEHYLVFWNPQNPPPVVYEYMEEELLFESVRMAGGVVIVAHPFRFNSQFDKRFLRPYPINGIEVKSTNIDEEGTKKALNLSNRMGLCPIAGSDAHSLKSVGKFYTEFQVPISNELDLIKAVCQRQCHPVINRQLVR